MREEVGEWSVVEQEKATKEKENVCEKRFALKRKEEGMLCYTFFSFLSFLFLYFAFTSPPLTRE